MYTPDNIFTTTIDKAVRWSRTQSMWPVTFGLACCAIEMMAAGSAKSVSYTHLRAHET